MRLLPSTPRSRSPGRWLLSTLASGALFACGDETTLPPISWSSEDFDFADEANYPLCGRTLDYQQTFVDLAQNIFGQPKSGRKFTYYSLFFDGDTFAHFCPPELTGCYREGQVFSTIVPDLHEATHAVVALAIGRSHPFFSEGIAEVFRDRAGGSRSSGMTTVEEGLGFDGIHAALPLELYPRAGHFMSYVLAAHGQGAALDLLTRARPGDSVDDLHGDLEAALGLEFAELMADYTTSPECRSAQYRWPITECTGAPLAARLGRWDLVEQLDCERDDVIGPRVGDQWTVRTIEVPAAGRYRITVTAAENAGALVEVGHCSPGCAPDKGIMVRANTQSIVELREGRYHVSLVIVDASEPIALSIAPEEPPVSPP